MSQNPTLRGSEDNCRMFKLCSTVSMEAGSGRHNCVALARREKQFYQLLIVSVIDFILFHFIRLALMKQTWLMDSNIYYLL